MLCSINSFKRILNTPQQSRTRGIKSLISPKPSIPSEDLSRATQLRKQLKKHSKAYYVNSKPLISDEEYDKLFKELIDLESRYPSLITKTSPTSHVGSSIKKGTNGVALAEHSKPMLSLANAFTLEGVLEFDERIHRMADIPSSKPLEYCVEFKYDGLALSLLYKKGELVRVLTRGDGKVGEDVTQAVKLYIPCLSKPLSDQHSQWGETIKIRGEAYITKSEFQKVNERSGNQYINPRNLASGRLRRKQEKNTGNNSTDGFEMSFVAYHLALSEDKQALVKTHKEALTLISKLGVPSGKPWISLLSSIHDFEALESQWSSQRDQLPFEADGMVIKLNDMSLYPVVGTTNHSPRYALAWKFSARQATTTLNHIELSVGRTGRITPVGLVTPASLSGSVISRVTLHNKDYIEKNLLVPGCKVVIERSGDVIPKIASRVDGPIDPSAAKSILSASLDWNICPCSQKQPLLQVNTSDTVCTSPICPPQRQRRLEHFCSVLDIEGLGPSTLEELVQWGLINDVADIFTLGRLSSKLQFRDGWGEKRISNLLDNINQAKHRAEFSTVLFALGIQRMGKELSKTIAKGAKSMDSLIQMTVPELLKLEDVGTIAANSIVTTVSNPTFKQLITKLKEAELPMSLTPKELAQIQAKEGADTVSGTNSSVLAGKTVVFTGTFGSMTRKEATELATSLGVTVKGIISKNTDYVVVGSAPDVRGKSKSSKLVQASENNIPVLTEEQFKALIQAPKPC